MSWAGIANNQCVSCENLQDGVNTSQFTLKNTIPSSDPAKYKQITKAEAAYYVNIDQGYAPYSVKASNQLVVKSNLIACTPLAYSYTIYMASIPGLLGYSTSAGACSASVYTYTVYSTSSSISVGTLLYSDPCGYNETALSSYDTAGPYFKSGSSYFTMENNAGSFTGYQVRTVGVCVIYYTYTVRLSNSLGTICTDPTYTVYSSSILLTAGDFIFYDTALTNPVTGYDYVVLASGAPDIYNMNPGTGELTSDTGIDC